MREKQPKQQVSETIAFQAKIINTTQNKQTNKITHNPPPGFYSGLFAHQHEMLSGKLFIDHEVDVKGFNHPRPGELEGGIEIK